MKCVLLAVAVPLLVLAGPVAAAPESLTVRVLDESGDPVAEATVRVLASHDVSLDGGLPSMILQESSTGKDGRVRFGDLGDSVCVHAFQGDRAAFACHHPLVVDGDGLLALRLEPAVKLSGTVADTAGKAISGVRVRALAPGGYEFHGFDAEVTADGRWRLPPLPPRVLGHAESTLEVRHPEYLPLDIALAGRGAESIASVLLVPRVIRGRVVGEDGKPVSDAAIHVALEETKTDGVGRFEVARVTPEATVVVVVPQAYAPRRVVVPPGQRETDLGSVVVQAGRPIRGTVVEADGTEIRRAFVALRDEGGHRIRTAEVDAEGTFVLPHVGDGAHSLDVWLHESKGIAGRRSQRLTGLRADGPAVRIEFPRGLVLRLRTPDGKPCRLTNVDLEVHHESWPRPWREEFWGGEGFDEIRLAMPPAEYTVSVRARGYEKATVAAVEVGAAGAGEAEFRLKPIPGVSHEPPQGPVISKPVSPELARIVLPPDATVEQAREYVREVLEVVGDRRSFSSSDPEVAKLVAVGPERVAALIDALESRQSGHSYLEWALDRLVTDAHRDLVVARLDGCRALAKLVLARGWGAAARDTLVRGLDALRGSASRRGIYMPTAWIDLVASFGDPTTYPALRHYLIHGLNIRWTWRAVRDLPGFDVEEAVAAAWKAAKDDPWRARDVATVAVAYGHRDALDRLVSALRDEGERSPYGTSEIRQAAKAYVDYVGTDNGFATWYEENRDRLVWDAERRRFRLKEK